ncbi:MAG TPA: hypothetical protein VGI75_05145 [Pirellulales bacterium]|jgi:hypothetical protein
MIEPSAAVDSSRERGEKDSCNKTPPSDGINGRRYIFRRGAN